MHYLFGDSTPSKLTTNFLEFLKDAVDFAVFALKTDDRIKRGQTQAAGLRREAVLDEVRIAYNTNHGLHVRWTPAASRLIRPFSDRGMLRPAGRGPPRGSGAAWRS